MTRTRAFNDDQGQGVLIPDEMAYADMDMELEIARCGDVITISPAHACLKETAKTLSDVPKLEHKPTPRTQSRNTRWD